MKILKYLSVILIMGIAAKAENTPQLDAELGYEKEMSLDMCHSIDHRFDSHSHECVYCAHGLHYDSHTLKCTGTPDVIGKCFGEDHYHANTQECMYCSKDYVFDEDIRECMAALEKKGDIGKKGD